MDDTTFLRAAEVAERVVGGEAVAERWHEASALQGYTVGGLAGHLARAVVTVGRYLDRPVPRVEPTDAAGYFVRVLAAHDPVDSDFHRRVRQRGEDQAGPGPGHVVELLGSARRGLVDRLADVDPRRLVAVLDDTVLPIGDYLDTRLVELVVHLDDLAVSVGADPPADVPEQAYERVASVLARVAVRRCGALPTVRSLSRRERHPEAVRAL